MSFFARENYYRGARELPRPKNQDFLKTTKKKSDEKKKRSTKNENEEVGYGNVSVLG